MTRAEAIAALTAAGATNIGIDYEGVGSNHIGITVSHVGKKISVSTWVGNYEADAERHSTAFARLVPLIIEKLGETNASTV